MNFFDNITNYNPQQPKQTINALIPITYDVNYKINELEQKIKLLEHRIAILETSNHGSNHQEPDNTLYML